jgi:hypothetical protein
MGDMDPDSVSLEFGIDIQAAVAERLAQKNKKTVQLNDLLKDTKFTKSEIRTMYRGFKQVSLPTQTLQSTVFPHIFSSLE